jgi:hypothetical protein
MNARLVLRANILMLCTMLVAWVPASDAVAQFDAVYAALNAKKLQAIEPQESNTPEGDRFREMASVDCDGNLIVLYAPVTV